MANRRAQNGNFGVAGAFKFEIVTLGLGIIVWETFSLAIVRESNRTRDSLTHSKKRVEPFLDDNNTLRDFEVQT